MKKTTLLFVSACAAISLMLTGCEWTSGGGVESFDSSENFIDVSGVYRATDGGVLVTEYKNSSATNSVTETIATGDGAQTLFVGSLNGSPMQGTVMITVGSYIFTDDGSSTLTVNQSDGTSGTINYETATVTLSFPAPIANGTSIRATYLSYHPSNEQGNHGTAIYTFTVFQEGNQLTIVDSNGTTYQGVLGSVRTTGGRPNDENAVDSSGVVLGPSDTTSALANGPVIAQFSAEGVSQGYSVDLVGVFQGTLDGATFSDRGINGTYMESGGYQADFLGVSGPGRADVRIGTNILDYAW